MLKSARGCDRVQFPKSYPATRGLIKSCLSGWLWLYVTSFDIIHQDMGTQQTCLDGPCCFGLDTAYSVICLHAHTCKCIVISEQSAAAVYLYLQICTVVWLCTTSDLSAGFVHAALLYSCPWCGVM